jgi:uncharacterized protein YjbI with pentapeptide repeats
MSINSLKELCIHTIVINNLLLQIQILPKNLQNIIYNNIKEYKKYNNDILNKYKIDLDKSNLDKSDLDESYLDESYLDESYLDKSDLDESYLDESYLDESYLDNPKFDKFGNKYNIYDSNSKNVKKFDDINNIGNNKKKLCSYIKKINQL